MPVWYGKYKNQRGTVKNFKENEKGDVLVMVDPVPKGRKKPKEMKLFKIRPRDEKDSSQGWELGEEVTAEAVSPTDRTTAVTDAVVEYRRL